MDLLSQQDWLQRITKHSHAPRESYRAMYSTWWDGIVTDPNLMLIPIDDHQVHRGDGVFEAFKVIDRKIYLEKEHLDRLDRSSQAIHLKNPFSREQTANILAETLRASGLERAVIRLFLGRGPGSFTANPYDSISTQMHVVVTDLTPPPEAKVKNGVSLAISKIPVKDPFMARIKSCNYLPNVLMKKEAIDQGVDYTVGVDNQGFLMEGSTENLILISEEGSLIRPKAEGILDGTTMLRAFELAQSLKDSGQIKSIGEKTFTVEDLRRAREVMMIGTTIDVLSVTQFEGRALGDGRPGPIAAKIRELLIQDQKGLS